MQQFRVFTTTYDLLRKIPILVRTILNKEGRRF